MDLINAHLYISVESCKKLLPITKLQSSLWLSMFCALTVLRQFVHSILVWKPV